MVSTQSNGSPGLKGMSIMSVGPTTERRTYRYSNRCGGYANAETTKGLALALRNQQRRSIHGSRATLMHRNGTGITGVPPPPGDRATSEARSMTSALGSHREAGRCPSQGRPWRQARQTPRGAHHPSQLNCRTANCLGQTVQSSPSAACRVGWKLLRPPTASCERPAPRQTQVKTTLNV